MKPIFACVLLALAASPICADEPGYLRVGFTGIVCIVAPCPSFGLTPADSSGGKLSEYVWAGDDLPSLVASESDAAAVRDAWDNKRCLLVQGAYADGMLYVDDVMGSCD